MSRENVELVERLYRLWNEDGSVADLLHPQFEWVQSPNAVEPGTHQGIAEARAGVAKIREIFPEFRLQPEKYVDTSDEVVVVIRARARTETGLETEWRGAHVWTVHEGKLARLRDFDRVEQALEAVGLRE